MEIRRVLIIYFVIVAARKREAGEGKGQSKGGDGNIAEREHLGYCCTEP